MFASCLHFWDKMQVSWDVQAETSHWLAALAVVQLREGRGREICVGGGVLPVLFLRQRSAGPTPFHPSPIPRLAPHDMTS